MGDPKRFWKESIGVTGPAGPKSPAPAPAKPTKRSARTAPATVVAATPPGAAIDQVLATLPIGSISFADEVARKLWPAPSASELRALATLIERQHGVGPTTRLAAYRTVTLRQRMLRLLEISRRATFDTVALQARSAEWSRLSQASRDASAALDEAEPTASDSPFMAASRELLPDPTALDCLAAIAAEASSVIDTLRAGGHVPALALCAIPDATSLASAIEHDAPRPGDSLFLDVLATAGLVHAAPTLEVLVRARRGVTLLSERLETAIGRSLVEHRRDPERNARYAEWKRCLADLRARVDEALTRPVAAPRGRTPAWRASGSTGPVTGTVAGSAFGHGAGPATGPVTGPLVAEPETETRTGPVTGEANRDLLPLDDAIVDHLRQVRAKVAPPPVDPEPSRPVLVTAVLRLFGLAK